MAIQMKKRTSCYPQVEREHPMHSRMRRSWLFTRTGWPDERLSITVLQSACQTNIAASLIWWGEARIIISGMFLLRRAPGPVISMKLGSTPNGKNRMLLMLLLLAIENMLSTSAGLPLAPACASAALQTGLLLVEKLISPIIIWYWHGLIRFTQAHQMLVCRAVCSRCRNTLLLWRERHCYLKRWAGTLMCDCICSSLHQRVMCADPPLKSGS